MAKFRELQKTQPLIGDVRGKGLMVGVELIADPADQAYGTAAAGFVRQYCLEHGVLIGVGGNFGSVLRIQPPLVIDDAQLDRVFATVADAWRRSPGSDATEPGREARHLRRPPGGRTPRGEGRGARSTPVGSRPSRAYGLARARVRAKGRPHSRRTNPGRRPRRRRHELDG